MSNVISDLVAQQLTSRDLRAEDDPEGRRHPGMQPTMHYSVEFWAAEHAHPWYEFNEAGFEVTVASPKGDKVQVDSYLYS